MRVGDKMDVIENLKRVMDEQFVFCIPPLSGGRKTEKPETPLHKHPYREIVLALEGENDFYLQDRNWHMRPGSVVLIDSWEPHSFGYRNQDHDLLHLWIYFMGNRIRTSFCQVGMQGHYNTLTGGAQLPPYYYPLINSRWNEFRKQEERTPELAEQYLLSPLHCLLEDLLLLNRRKNQAEPERSDLIFAVKLYIETQNARDCSLEDLEKKFGYSRYYIAHKFREDQGMPLGDYINTVRLAFTEDALMKGLKQKEIAYELGFSSSSAFWKWFRNNRE